MPIKSAAAYWASRQAKLIAEDAQVHAAAEATAQQRRTARNKKKKQRQKRRRQSLQVSAVENKCVQAKNEHDEAYVQPKYTEAAFSARGACWAQVTQHHKLIAVHSIPMSSLAEQSSAVCLCCNLMHLKAARIGAL
ncbi:hypothetical protein ABBQ38_013230 [Trebouxia sp. C0009 RCD-2024]